MAGVARPAWIDPSCEPITNSVSIPGTSSTGQPAEIADVISRAVDHALANTPLTTTIVYRDTPFGHDRCAAHKGGEPLASNAAAEEWLRRHPGPARYNWSNIPKVNAAARRALEDRLRHPSRLLWLPAASISATRIDAHPANAHPATDCLHYCMPGPTDAWASALYNQLMRESGPPPHEPPRR